MQLYLIAGHGAGDPGAMGNGYNEAERVRALCSRIKALGGNKVVYLDPNQDWYRTAGISSYAFPADAQVLECHLDSASAGAKGGHVIIKTGYNPDQYDTALANNLKAMFPGRSEIIVKRSDLANVNRAANRGVAYRLAEFCFITNYDDITKFSNQLDEVAKLVLKSFNIPVSGGSTASGTWVQKGNRWWYKYTDGSYPAAKWELINGKWYHFDSEGWMQTGWLKDGYRWAWLNENGDAAQDTWKYINRYWYYFDSKCYAVVGWAFIAGKWYYFNEDCQAAQSDCRKLKGNWYAFDSNCAMIEGSVQLNSKGAMIL